MFRWLRSLSESPSMSIMGYSVTVGSIERMGVRVTAYSGAIRRSRGGGLEKERGLRRVLVHWGVRGLVRNVVALFLFFEADRVFAQIDIVSVWLPQISQSFTGPTSSTPLTYQPTPRRLQEHHLTSHPHSRSQLHFLQALPDLFSSLYSSTASTRSTIFIPTSALSAVLSSAVSSASLEHGQLVVCQVPMARTSET
jgi:hypothetical protein